MTDPANNAESLVPLDRRILHVLQVQGRLSNEDLAPLVNASPSACSRHRRKMEESGFIKGYVALVDQQMAGLPDDVFVTIGLSDQRPEHQQEFESAVAEIEEVMACYATMGTMDYLLRVVARNALDYDRIRARLPKLPHVEHLHSETVTRQVLRRTELPVRGTTG